MLLASSAALAEAKATIALVAAPLVNQCNGIDNAGGQAVACTVAVVNNLNVGTGLTSSSVTTNECRGAANAPLICTTETTTSIGLITSVVQCDGSGSGGGGTVTCSVSIVNNITGATTTAPATISQCNASGEGGGIQPTVRCDPIGSTTGATITQCNGSGNGGGGTIRVQCTVGPSTQTSALSVTVDQCNGSGNGGGATVTCTVSLVNNLLPGTDVPTGPPEEPAPNPVSPTPIGPTPIGPTPGPAPGFPVFGPPLTGTPLLSPPSVSTPLRSPPSERITTASTPRGGTPAVPPSTTLTGLPRTGVGTVPVALVALLAVLLGNLLLGCSRVTTKNRRRPLTLS